MKKILLIILLILSGCSKKIEISDMEYLKWDDFHANNVGFFTMWKPNSGMNYLDFKNLKWMKLSNHQSIDNELYTPPYVSMFSYVNGSITYLIADEENRNISLLTVEPDGTNERELFKINKNNNIINSQHEGIYFKKSLFFVIDELKIAKNGKLEVFNSIYRYNFDNNKLIEITPSYPTLNNGYNLAFAKDNYIYFQNLYDLETGEPTGKVRLYKYDLISEEITFESSEVNQNITYRDMPEDNVYYVDNITKKLMEYNIQDRTINVSEIFSGNNMFLIFEGKMLAVNNDNKEYCLINTMSKEYKCLKNDIYIPDTLNDKYYICTYYSDYEETLKPTPTSQIKFVIIEKEDFYNFNFNEKGNFYIND